MGVSKLKLGMSKAEFYKLMAIALAMSLIISWALFYSYYVNTQPSVKLPPFKEEPFHVQGIISVYKNGQLVYEGPDVLTNSFYQYLPFLLGNVCAMATTDAPTACPTANWPSTVFTAAPPALSCSLSQPNTAGPSRVPITFAPTNPALNIGIDTAGYTPSPTDCVVASGSILLAIPSVAVYSPFTNNANNPPAPCPNPTQGCVQISAQFNLNGYYTLRDAMLYAAYSYASGQTLWSLIAHDSIATIYLNPGDSVQIVYTFIFPGVPTNTGAYNEDQGAIAALFAQCLSRQHFNIGPAGNRLCLDAGGVYAYGLDAYVPANPCSDTTAPTSFVGRGTNKITIEANAGSKYVRIYAPMSAPGRGPQMVVYSITAPGPTFISILKGSQTCSLATQSLFAAGQSVGLQLTFP
ncbi:MAG: hypothetical protein C4292_07070 [Nitrososphaera sp.]